MTKDEWYAQLFERLGIWRLPHSASIYVSYCTTRNRNLLPGVHP
jgi:hypothetical protein